MTDHDEARMLASARADGEAYDAAALDAHLAACPDCAAYADGLARLSTLARALPREEAPRDLPTRIARRRRGRRLLRWAPALAGATVVAFAMTVLPGSERAFRLPDAAAAEPLRGLRSLYVERTVTTGDSTAVERIWWRAPASVRVERVENGETTLWVETPGRRYDGVLLTEGAEPRVPLPEPLSPTVSLLGTDSGPGPFVAGRPTRRVDLRIGGGTRTAYVDVERALALGADESLVLAKMGGSSVKRVTRVDVDPGIPDHLFEPPAGPAVPGGFRRVAARDLRIAPVRLPRGFSEVHAAIGDGREAALYADGSLPLLVTTAPADPSPTAELRTVTRGQRTFLVTLDLYALPSVELAHEGVTLRVVAPLPVESLVDLAERLYPE